MSLYRKYRPQKFGEVICQEHVVKTLEGALKSNQVGHAYIFAGPRGTGKTSVARILAKAVNCLDLKDSEPCDKCDVCKQITNGNFLDLIEIDAASNRGIDEIRDLKEKIMFAPSVGKYKVYIIDEVHMLTREAFNALLKTLEEPPEHALFVLATTEVHKLPLTIISRCQSFDFHKIDSGKMLDGIRKVAKKEKIKIDDKDLRKIIALSEGSIRDALSYLDQVYAFSGGKNISSSLLEDILGYSRQESLVEVLNLIKKKDIKNIIVFINKLIEEGIDLRVFLKNLIIFIRKLLLVKIDKDILADELVDGDVVKSLINNFSLDELVKLSEVLNDVVNSSKFSFLPQLYLELAIIKLLKNEKDDLESEADSLVVEEIKVKPQVVDRNREVEKQDTRIDEKIIGDEKDFLQKIKSENLSVYMSLQGSKIFENKNIITIKVNNQFYFDRLQDENNHEFLKAKVKECFGQDKKLEIIKAGKKIERKRDIVADALSVFGGEVIE